MKRSGKPLTAKKPLTSGTTLKASKPLQKRSTKPTKQVKPMVSKLKKKADKIFSRAIRFRDGQLIEGEWIVDCITCDARKPFKAMQAGHFQSRRYNATRFDYENVNAQCYRCNVMFYGEQYKYAQAIDMKYGDGVARRLEEQAKEPHPFSIEELENIITDASNEVYFYEAMS